VNVEIARLGPDNVAGVAGVLAAVYREAFGAGPYFGPV
jgi:hypothetical protein